jgi:hypothetical protein
MNRSLRRVLSAAGILAGIALWAQPGYVELSIPVAQRRGGGDFWWEQQRSQLAYADALGVSFIHR